MGGVYSETHFLHIFSRGSQIFYRGYFVGLKFFSQVNYFVGPRFWPEGNFVILSSWPNEKKWHRNIPEILYFIPNRFLQL